MKLSGLAAYAWGPKARFSYLFLATILLLFTLLGARDIWTQEHRWADIVTGMFYRQDFLHPYLGQNQYYDKPLLSYWLIALIAQITGILNTWVLRLPSALAGILAVWSVYRLGATVRNRSLGLLAGWLLLTTFYFIFWARTSSADMLNLAGSIFAVSWYAAKREQPRFFDYAVFFMIVALTSLCKGLVGAVVPMIAVAVDLTLRKAWKQQFKWSIVVAAIPALVVYALPFWASNHFGGASYGQDGLYLVYRENIVRYFQPFDHQGPIYTYFLYLPIYTLPWAVFLIPALWTLPKRWRSLSLNSTWVAWTLFALFVFFTLSGSRRSYYVLPMVPFAILFMADWMLSEGAGAWAQRWASRILVLTFALLLLLWDVGAGWYAKQTGVARFAAALQQEAGQKRPWDNWQIVMLDAESKLNFYLRLPPTVKNYPINGALRTRQTEASLRQAWPILLNKPKNAIFITRLQYVPLLQSYFKDYQVFVLSSPALPLLKKHDTTIPVAFIPNTNIN